MNFLMKAKNVLAIEKKTGEPCIDIALSTMNLDKQLIIFVNTKRSAESLAEKISQKIKKLLQEHASDELSNMVLKTLSTPTKQCLRLSEMIKYGVAFHHAGLVAEQKTLIENNFRLGKIKVIVATPTLAVGVDLPAYRVVIRDLKRFGLWGMDYIPVLEYEQQAGRAGRPSYDNHGEAICIANTDAEKDEIHERYINGKPEEIISKLAVEPVMRTYILSLISSGFVKSRKELEDFFSRTFYAKHYEDNTRLNLIIGKMLTQLKDWNFINIEGEGDDFVSAFKKAYDKDVKIQATLVGRRVSELYIDPYTANFLIKTLESAKEYEDVSIMHMICSCLELRPLLRVKNSEIDRITEYHNIVEDKIITEIPELFEEEYHEFLCTLKTTRFFMDWMDEKDEEYLMEHYDIRPGEINTKKDIADWLLYSSEELAKLWKMQKIIKDISKIRFRLKYGAREELIPLLQLKNIGRVRARIMYHNRIRTIGDVKNIDLTTLTQLLGKAVALDVKKQVGQELSQEKVTVKENKRKGQINLGDYGE